MAITRTRATSAERKAKAAAARKAKNAAKNEAPAAATVPPIDPFSLDDKQLLETLKRLGATVGPINDSTRSLYIRRLGKLMKEKGVQRLDLMNEKEEDNREVEEQKTRKGRKKEEAEKKENEPKKKQGGRSRKTIVQTEEEKETEAVIPDQREEKAVDRLDGRQEGRKKDKKVSFARVDAGQRKRSDEEEKTEEEEDPPQATRKKRNPSVQILAVKPIADKKKKKEGRKEIRENRRITRRTIVIEEEEEKEEAEGRVETSAVTLTEEEEEEVANEKTLPPPVVHRRESRRIVAEEKEKEKEEEDQESQEEEESNGTLNYGGEEMDLMPSGEEDEGEAVFVEEMEREETPPRRSVMTRAILTVDTPQEEHVASSRLIRRKETLDILRGRVSHDASRNDETVVDESEDMDISPVHGDQTAVPHKKNEIEDTVHYDSVRMFGEHTNRLFLDDSFDMDISNTPRDTTMTVLKQVHTIVPPRIPPLIADTPKSSRVEFTEKKEGPRKMMRRREEGESFRVQRVPLNGRWAREGEISPRPHLYDASLPLEDPFTHRDSTVVDESVEMDSFNEFLGGNGGNRHDSTIRSEANGGNLFGKTFVVKDKTFVANDRTFVVKDAKKKLDLSEEEEAVNDATYVVAPARREERKTGKRETTHHLTRNVVRTPSRSPSRDRRRISSFIDLSSGLTPKKTTPARPRAPKPMPRRIGDQRQSTAPSGPPVPAPRRVAPPNAPMERKSRIDGRREEGGISPASLFHTQPRLREEREKEQLTEEDREDIAKLKELLEKMKEQRKMGRFSTNFDLERRLIIERAPHLKKYF